MESITVRATIEHYMSYRTLTKNGNRLPPLDGPRSRRKSQTRFNALEARLGVRMTKSTG